MRDLRMPANDLIALLAAALNSKGTSSERVDLAMDLWQSAEKALKPAGFKFSKL
jgi:hypothetical protein